MHREHKLITQNEKARCQVLLEISKQQGNLLHPEVQEVPRILKLDAEKWPYNFHMSPAAVSHMEKVYSIVRQIYGRSPTDDLNDLNVNTAICGIFLNVTIQAAVHLGQDYMENLRLTKNYLLKSVK